MPVSAHTTGRPSINKHKSNEKQHNTLQLGHFKHVQEELRTPMQQSSRDRANSCLPYTNKVPCRQETHGSVLLSRRVWGLEVQPSTTRPTVLSSRCGVREWRITSGGERGNGKNCEAEIKGFNMKSGVYPNFTRNLFIFFPYLLSYVSHLSHCISTSCSSVSSAQLLLSGQRAV